MENKVYVCTKFNEGSIATLLNELAEESSTTWYRGEKPIDFVPYHLNGYLLIVWNKTSQKHCLVSGIDENGAKLVTPNEFKRIAAELCPKG